MPRTVASRHEGHLRVAGLVEMYVAQQGDHGDVAGDGEDVDGG